MTLQMRLSSSTQVLEVRARSTQYTETRGLRWVITLVESSVITQGRQSDSAVHQSFCQSNGTHARARNRIGRSRTLPSVIDRRRAPTGKKRPSRGRYVAVLYPRPIFEQRARPFLLTPPPEFASVGPSSVAEQCSSR